MPLPQLSTIACVQLCFVGRGQNSAAIPASGDSPQHDPRYERGFADTVATRDRKSHCFPQGQTVTDCAQHLTLPRLRRFAFEFGALPIEHRLDKADRISPAEHQLISDCFKSVVAHCVSLNSGAWE